jgi:molybdenum cofactor biosynthesis protein B
MSSPGELPPLTPDSQHRSADKGVVRCAAITVSDTRTLEDDKGGQTLVQLLEAAGHQASVRQIVPDEPTNIRQIVGHLIEDPNIDAILLTGGTGISSRDQTCETVAQMLTKPLPGYSELLRMLSYQEIGPAAILSRALGGVAEQTIVLTMPGSPAPVRLAMEQVILPVLGHLVREATK